MTRAWILLLSAFLAVSPRPSVSAATAPPPPVSADALAYATDLVEAIQRGGILPRRLAERRRDLFAEALRRGMGEAAAAALVQSTISVCASGCTYANASLQTALDAAVASDSVLLQAGFTYTGCFTLRRHGGGSNVTLRTGVTSTGTVINVNTFPAANIRMTPALATSSNLAKLQCASANEAALRTANPSGGVAPANWHVKWIEGLHNSSVSLGSGPIFQCGSDSNSVQTQNSEIPSGFTFEQIYLHGHAVKGQHRGFAVHCNNFTLRDSTIKDIKSQAEGQVVWGSSFTTTHLVTNNYLEGGTEVALYGGSSGCCRPTATIASAASATAFTLSTIVDLKVGQLITVENGSAVEEQAEVVSCGTSTPGAACNSTSITVTPALPSGTPSNGADVDWGPVPVGITYTKNYMTRPVSHRDPIVGTPQGVTAIAGTGGSLAAGTYAYRVVARMPTAGSQTARSTASVEVSTTVTSSGTVKVDWAAVVNAEEYYIYGRQAGAQNLRFSVTTSACTANVCTFTDTGTGGTSEAVPTSTGTTWLVKNVFEVKLGKTFLLEGNVFEHSWKSGQDGYAVLFTVSNSNSGNDSTLMQDIIFRNNIVRGATGAFQLTGRDVSSGCDPTGRTIGVTISNNLFYDLGPTWGASTRFLLVTTKSVCSAYASGTAMGPKDVTVEHNTVVMPSGNALLYLDLFKTVEQAAENMIWRNNLAYKAGGGLAGNNSCSQGNSCWTAHTSGTAVWAKSVTADISCSSYPGGSTENFCPTASDLNLTFVDYLNNDYRLKSDSPYKNAATDGTDIGANIGAITTLTNIAISGDDSGGTPILPPQITVTSLPPGQVGTPYSQTVTATCPAPPCTWAQTGTLPLGVTLGAATSTTQVIAGTPLAPGGTFEFTLTITDVSGVRMNSATYSVTITAVPQVIDGRADRFDLHEGVQFRRATDPATDGEPVRVGDLWSDLSCSTVQIKLTTQTGPSVIWKTIAFRPEAVVTTKTTAGAVTYTAAELVGGLILRDPNGAPRSDVTPTATQFVTGIPCAEVGSTFEFDLRNTADAAETITLTAGTDVTLSGTMTVAQNNTRRFRVVITNVATPAATVYSIGTFVH